MEAFETHCDRVLLELVRFLRQVEGELTAEGSEWILEKFAAEADHAAAALRTKARRRPEQNRLLNAAGGRKAQARERLQAELARLQSGSGPGDLVDDAASGGSDLDDRLPLLRRRVFDRDLAAMARTSQAEAPLALVMIDIDFFKRVNDEHGHPAGDDVLRVVAVRIHQAVGGKGRAYRYGGEEIALLLPNYSAAEAAALGERIRRHIEASPIGGHRLTITASLGVACLPDHAADAATLLESADAALYEAKTLGRNRLRVSGDPKG
jgi:diguanylate cyclase (GGDEF)-like protein